MVSFFLIDKTFLMDGGKTLYYIYMIVTAVGKFMKELFQLPFKKHKEILDITTNPNR